MILQEGTPPKPRPMHVRGPSLRLGKVTHIFDYIPPFTIKDIHGVTAHTCGKCFSKLGDDPIGGKAGKMTPGAPKNAICVFCGRRAWPYEGLL